MVGDDLPPSNQFSQNLHGYVEVVQEVVWLSCQTEVEVSSQDRICLQDPILI